MLHSYSSVGIDPISSHDELGSKETDSVLNDPDGNAEFENDIEWLIERFLNHKFKNEVFIYHSLSKSIQESMPQ